MTFSTEHRADLLTEALVSLNFVTDQCTVRNTIFFKTVVSNVFITGISSVSTSEKFLFDNSTPFQLSV